MKNLISLLFLAFSAFFIISCQSKTADTQATEAEEMPPVEQVASTTGTSQVYQVNPASSKVHWEGYKPAVGTTHIGTVNVSSGTISVNNGIVESGNFVLDMTTITDNDLEGESKAKLEAHLKGTAEGKENDFFNVSQFPTGKFVITKTTALENDPEANTMVYGNLTLRNVTKPVAFKANVDVTNGLLTANSPMFKIDRTEWDIQVLSKKFFDNLKDGFVDDQIGLRIALRADATQNM